MKVVKIILSFLFIGCNAVGNYNSETLSSLLLLNYRQNVTLSGTFFGVFNSNVRASKVGADGKCETEARGVETINAEGKFQISYPRISNEGGIVCLYAYPKADGTSKFLAVDQQKTVDWVGNDKFQVLLLPEPSTTSRSAFNVVSTPFNRMASRRLERLAKGNTDMAKTASYLKTANRQIVSQFGLSKGITKSLERISSVESAIPDLTEIPLDFSKSEDPSTLKFLIMIGGLHKLAIPEKPDTYNDVVKVVAEYVSSGTGNSSGEDGKPLLLPRDEPANGGSGIPLSSGNSLSSQVSNAVQSFVKDKAAELGIPAAAVTQIASQVVVQDKPVFGPTAPPTPSDPPPTVNYSQSEYMFTQGTKIAIYPSYTGVSLFFLKGSLPGGLIMDKNTGEISGIVNTLGSSSFQITASGSGGDKIVSLKIGVVSVPTITIQNPSQCSKPEGSITITCKYTKGGLSITPMAAGVQTFSGSGKLPQGLTLNSVDGSITGNIVTGSIPCSYTENTCIYTITGTGTGVNTSVNLQFIELPSFTYPSTSYKFTSTGIEGMTAPQNQRALTGFNILTNPTSISINSSGILSYVAGSDDTNKSLQIVAVGNGGTSDPVTINLIAKPSLSYSTNSISLKLEDKFQLLPQYKFGVRSFEISSTTTLPVWLKFNTTTGEISTDKVTTIIGATTFTVKGIGDDNQISTAQFTISSTNPYLITCNTYSILGQKNQEIQNLICNSNNYNVVDWKLSLSPLPSALIETKSSTSYKLSGIVTSELNTNLSLYYVTDYGSSNTIQINLNVTIYPVLNNLPKITVYNTAGNTGYAYDASQFTAFQQSYWTEKYSPANVVLNWYSYTTLTANGISIPNSGDNFSVKVDGIFAPRLTGTYTFTCAGDDAVDLFINGTNVCNHYGPHGTEADGLHTGTIDLIAGNAYTFRARQQEYGGGDGLVIKWKKPGSNTWEIDTSEIGNY